MVQNNKYANANQNAYEQNISPLSEVGSDIRVALLDDGYTPDLDVHANWTDVSDHEIPDTTDGYSSPGQLLDNKTFSRSGDTVTFDADNTVWEDSTITAYYAVVYDDTAADDVDKKLICLVDFEGEESSEDGDFTIDWDDTDGIFTITANPE